jgi:hypothetical protein
MSRSAAALGPVSSPPAQVSKLLAMQAGGARRVADDVARPCREAARIAEVPIRADLAR